MIASPRIQALPFIFVLSTPGNGVLDPILSLIGVLKQLGQGGSVVLTKDGRPAMKIGATQNSQTSISTWILEIWAQHLVQQC